MLLLNGIDLDYCPHLHRKRRRFCILGRFYTNQPNRVQVWFDKLPVGDKIFLIYNTIRDYHYYGLGNRPMVWCWRACISYGWVFHVGKGFKILNWIDRRFRLRMIVNLLGWLVLLGYGVNVLQQRYTRSTTIIGVMPGSSGKEVVTVNTLTGSVINRFLTGILETWGSCTLLF